MADKHQVFEQQLKNKSVINQIKINKDWQEKYEEINSVIQRYSLKINVTAENLNNLKPSNSQEERELQKIKTMVRKVRKSAEAARHDLASRTNSKANL